MAYRVENAGSILVIRSGLQKGDRHSFFRHRSPSACQRHHKPLPLRQLPDEPKLAPEAPAIPVPKPGRESPVARESNVLELRRAGTEFLKAAVATTASGLATLFRKHPRVVWGTFGGVVAIVLCLIVVETPLVGSIAVS